MGPSFHARRAAREEGEMEPSPLYGARKVVIRITRPALSGVGAFGEGSRRLPFQLCRKADVCVDSPWSERRCVPSRSSLQFSFILISKTPCSHSVCGLLPATRRVLSLCFLPVSRTTLIRYNSSVLSLSSPSSDDFIPPKSPSPPSSPPSLPTTPNSCTTT